MEEYCIRNQIEQKTEEDIKKIKKKLGEPRRRNASEYPMTLWGIFNLVEESPSRKEKKIGNVDVKTTIRITTNQKKRNAEFINPWRRRRSDKKDFTIG